MVLSYLGNVVSTAGPVGECSRGTRQDSLIEVYGMGFQGANHTRLKRYIHDSCKGVL